VLDLVKKSQQPVTQVIFVPSLVLCSKTRCLPAVTVAISGQ